MTASETQHGFLDISTELLNVSPVGVHLTSVEEYPDSKITSIFCFCRTNFHA